ncbi:sigma-54-dependent Fis family transcriptional regulator [candidate division LCP-89 bacterium B3_LCP]|uniref:Sigma-54-dependent Fis family transcriptional regulator n=1 Tax=candidate division LCP-89 bacterium B3_LCP TaxID=2012998 RepID=A0A532UVQ2_UNCL8|nr:MAG: sigma-54-dependent Fis family transcriptional regulator [candidate division LCP-89 bacterium B3_LCP]
MNESGNELSPEQQQALLDIGQAINSIPQKQPLLEKVMDIAAEAIKAERGFLVLKDGDSNTLRMSVALNMTEGAADSIIKPSASVVNKVLQENTPLWTVDAQDDPRLSGSQSIVNLKITAVACVPLILKGETIGVIYLDSTINRQRFNESTLSFLQAFANQAALAIENARLIEALQIENRMLHTELQRTYGFPEIIGNSTKMQAVFDMMSKILHSDISVLLEGESGTGKELVARAIHYNGHRRDYAFLAQFCGNLSESLLESELFGHKKGSFTGAISDKRGLFEIADNGTFFLDEIADISPTIQAKLLRVLQEGIFRRVGDTEDRKVDVRIISATNKNLRIEVEKGNFREDLYYRLNVISMTMPPLRERRTDIPVLVHHVLKRIAEKSGQKIRKIEANALKALTRYNWPGNVRELENTIERAVVLADNSSITTNDLLIPESSAEGLTPRTLKEQEKEIVLKTLEECEGNKTRTADVLGVSLRWLHYKLSEWNAGKTKQQA